MHINIKGLIGKLDDTSRRALEGAAGLCLSRTHYDVDIEHLVTKLLEMSDTDLHRIFRHYGVETARMSRDLTRVLDGFKTGNVRTPSLTPRVPRLINEAWSLASIEYGANRVRSGHLLLALLAADDLARMMRETSPEIQKISPEDLHKRFREIVAGSKEDGEEMPTSGLDIPAQPGMAPLSSKTPSLDQFTVDLTARAKQGQIDPVLGRDAEIRQVIDILTRRRQNNPILTGEAGVGKTAVVEGLALRVAAGDVPPPLKKVAIRVLDLALLQAGAGVKGEFENRLKSVINEVKASPQPIIMFIDEAHTMIGAGGQAGQGDAANLLKPALARGELRTIAATTWAEYKKYFEKDPALTRRFQVVKVEEPSEATAINMMRGLVGTLEEHHKVRVLDEAIEAAVKWSHRYISGRQLPDKAVSVLDTACARVALGQVAEPPAIEDARRRIALINTEIGILEREAVTGGNHVERIDEIARAKASEEQRLGDLQKRWEQEKQLVTEIAAIRQKLEQHASEKKAGGQETASPLSVQELERLQTDLVRLNKELTALQGENPLLQPCVDAQAIAQVISGWTGIPIGRMVKDEINMVLSLKDHLEKRVIGQSHALEAVSQRLRTARAKLEDPRRPIGVFMFVGPSGVGKTETALALAELLFGSDQNLTTINMSEFKEEHKVSLLMGSPPGYVGYGEGGVLTEAVRRKPYSVVLLDEMEKAHVGVQDIFYQVFDKGTMKDGEGRDIDFKNTVIIMTSNAGTDTFMKVCTDPETKPEPEGLAEAIRPDLLKYFKPAFLGRVIVVPFYPIAPDIMRRIIELQLSRVRNRIKDNHRAVMTYDDMLITAIADRCKEVESGARNVDHILTRTMLPELSKEFLARMAGGEQVSKVHIGVSPEGGFCYSVS